MLDPRQMMINALEDRNDILRKEIAELREKNRTAERYRRAGTFYLRMQELIIADENIKDAWDDFYTILALAAPDTKVLGDNV